MALLRRRRRASRGRVRGGAPTWRHEVLRSFPHDREAFTQGLLFRDGVLYESTGLNGRSSLRQGRARDRQGACSGSASDARYFAEGLAAWGIALMQLTWETNIGFVYDRATFKQLPHLHLSGRRLGADATTAAPGDERRHARRSGSSIPQTLAEIGRVRCSTARAAVDDLNELEVVKGEIFANVWLTDRIADHRAGDRPRGRRGWT